MGALKLTAFIGHITWLGRVSDRAVALESQPVDVLSVGFSGAEGEAHAGLTRASCSRVSGQYPQGTRIRNTRQLSLLSQEDLDQIASAMDLPILDPALLGTSMVITGLPDFSHLPPSSCLQGEDGATLVVDMLNRPCSLPARPVENHHPGYGKLFKPAAKDRRGITAWVEREGRFRLGEAIRLHIPDQRAWLHSDASRSDPPG